MYLYLLLLPCLGSAAVLPQRPAFTLITGGVTPVISDAQRAADAGFGFEGGRVVRTSRRGTLYYFTAEFQGWPINANMRLAIWRSTNRTAGPWERRSTIIASVGDNSSIAAWNKTCSRHNLLASPWAPFPVFDADDNRWHIHAVSYACDLSWVVRVGVGNIVGFRSTVAGEEAGIEGPYELYTGNGVVIGPSAAATAVYSSSAPPLVHPLRWGDLTRDCAACHGGGASPPAPPPSYCSYAPCRFDNGKTGGAISTSPFALPPNASAKFASFVGLNHDLAYSNAMAGPWVVGTPTALGEQLAATLTTPSSPYTENPVVTRISVPGRSEPGFVAVFDTVSPSGGWVADASTGEWKSGEGRGEWYGFGVSFSYDGVYWSPGVDVSLPGGVRTPLGLVEYPTETGEYVYELLFTRRFADCAAQTGGLPKGGRGDANNGRSMCANLYAASFGVTWGTW